jgi:hypothetical protein
MSIKVERPPMILPWLAHKSGIPIEVAETFWHEARTDAARRYPVGSSKYCKVAIDSVLEKIAAETLVRQMAPFGFGIWLRLPVRLWLYGINCGEAWALAAARRWPGAAF